MRGLALGVSGRSFTINKVLPSWPSGEDELNTYAERHVHYEIDMVTRQARRLVTRHPTGMPSPGTGFPCEVDDALLEALLVHLRLLNDFLGPRKHPRDVVASDWLPSWESRGFLTEEQQRRINKQLAHLSCDRDWGFKWDVRAMTTACCLALKEFFEALEHDEPRRAKAFRASRKLVEQWFNNPP